MTPESTSDRQPASLFVTGATGFLGEHFLRHVAPRGHRLHALARATSRCEHLADLPIEWHPGDVTAADEVDAAVAAFVAAEGPSGAARWLVHGAARISYRTDSGPGQDAANIDGTRHVLEAAERHGIDRLLLVSSVVGVGVAPAADATIDEDTPFEAVRAITGRAYVGDYMRTKRAAEELALAAHARGGLDVVVVNPGAIFGEAATPSNTAEVFKRIERGGLGRLAAPGSISVVGAGDVAVGMRLALERGSGGRRYLLTDENLRLHELMERVLATLGSQARVRRLGPGAWRALVAATRLLDRLRPQAVVTPTALELLGLHFRFDSRRAREELGWSPRPFDEVLAETATWLRRIGWIAPGR